MDCFIRGNDAHIFVIERGQSLQSMSDGKRNSAAYSTDELSWVAKKGRALDRDWRKAYSGATGLLGMACAISVRSQMREARSAQCVAFISRS